MIAIGRELLTEYVPCRRALKKNVVQQGQTNLFIVCDSDPFCLCDLKTQLNHASETSKSLPETNEFIFNIFRIQATLPSFRFSDLVYPQTDLPILIKTIQLIRKYVNRPLPKNLIYKNSSILFFKERLNQVGLTSSDKEVKNLTQMAKPFLSDHTMLHTRIISTRKRTTTSSWFSENFWT